jgi:hypothetical protein
MIQETNAVYFELHTHKNSFKSFVSNHPVDCCCYTLQPDATSLKNYNPQQAFHMEPPSWVSDAKLCVKCMLHTCYRLFLH